MLDSQDHEKIRDLRLTVFAEKFLELVNDEANDKLLPEEVFMQAVDHSLDIASFQQDRQAHQASPVSPAGGLDCRVGVSSGAEDR